MEHIVKSYMTGSPIALDVEASALSALDTMIDHGIRHLPVIDAERRVVGVLSFDDLRAAFPVPISLTQPPDGDERSLLRDIGVGDVMTHAPFTVLEGEPLEEAAQTMAERRIGCLPVVDEAGCIRGILSETDLLYALVTVLWADRRGGGRPPAVGRSRGLAELLREERDRIARLLEGYDEAERDLSEEERDSPIDEGERGSHRQDAAQSEALGNHAARRLRALEHALERADRGQLGRCERCDGTIPDGRLRALPGTTLCIRCARASEGDGA